MPVLNIPLGANYTITLRDYITKEFSQFYPNFGKICVITPSKETAKTLKSAFSKNPVIMPKIISLYELVEKADFTILSSLKAKLLLFDIVQKYLPKFSTNDIFYFIDDFLELEALITKNKTDLISSISSLEGLIENMASHIQSSIIMFLKIFSEWQSLKLKHNFQTQTDSTITITDNLKKQQFEEYEAVFLAYFQGGSKSQVEFISHINSLKHGFVVINNAEEITQKLKLEAVNIKTEITKPNCFIMEQENIPSLVNQITLKAISILQANPNAKIGFICYNNNTGTFLTQNFKTLQIPVVSIYGEGISQNPFFTLFLHYLNNEDLFSFLSLTKSSFTIFEKDEVFTFEEQLKSPNLKAKPPFNVVKIKLDEFSKFLQTELENFKTLLKKDAMEEEDFLQFHNFIEEVQTEGQGFKGESLKVYSSLLSSFAKSVRFRMQESENIFILSGVEARGMTFDHLFLTDLVDGTLPTPPNANKILSHYVQKLLKINEKSEELEWLDFNLNLYSSKFVYACLSKTQFEEDRTYLKSPFLMHVMEHLTFEPVNELFYTQDAINLQQLNPPFDISLIEKLSPTSFEKLINHPFQFYAEYVLKLKNQEAISQDLSKMVLGNIVHSAIYEFHKNGTNILNYCKKALENIGYGFEFELYVKAFLGIQNFFEKQEERPNRVIMEEFIQTYLKVNDQKILLHGKPDRIEFYENEVKIIDYKVYSGTISEASVQTGIKPQLPFLGYILSSQMPEIKQKIKLYYCYINLNNASNPIQISKAINFDNFEIVKNSIEYLLLNLQTFIIKDGEDYSKLQSLIRFYE